MTANDALASSRRGVSSRPRPIHICCNVLWAQRGRQYMTSNDNTLLDKIGALVTTGSHRAMANEAVRAPALGGVTERLDAQDDDAHGAYNDEVPITRSEGAKHNESRYS